MSVLAAIQQPEAGLFDGKRLSPEKRPVHESQDENG